MSDLDYDNLLNKYNELVLAYKNQLEENEQYKGKRYITLNQKYYNNYYSTLNKKRACY
jgi:hypothetical protein